MEIIVKTEKGKKAYEITLQMFDGNNYSPDCIADLERDLKNGISQAEFNHIVAWWSANVEKYNAGETDENDDGLGVNYRGDTAVLTVEELDDRLIPIVEY